MRNKLIMKYPASWHGDMWREAAPTGNGKIGAMVYGSVYEEFIQLVHCDLWCNGMTEQIPDVSGEIGKMREMLLDKKFSESREMVIDALKKNGYTKIGISKPLPFCDMKVLMKVRKPFKKYRREINMETGEICVRWNENSTEYSRKCFVSRVDDTFRYKIESSGILPETIVGIDIHDTETLGNLKPPSDVLKKSGESLLFFAVKNYIHENYGAVAKVSHNGTEEYSKGRIVIKNADCIDVKMCFFINENTEESFLFAKNKLSKTDDTDYDSALKEHSIEHGKIFNATKLDLGCDSRNKSNEELLLNAYYEGENPTELVEKMWSFGRYLLICSTGKGKQPCHLYGLWTGDYNAMWAFNMFNVNLEMMYWQTLSGNMPELLLSVFDYLENHIEDYRENAKKIYGCRGINIPSVSTPESGLYKNISMHILHWTGAAGWLSQHYYDYYQYTGDEKFLKDRAMPFMHESALFYEDFLIEDDEGYFISVPSNSPENTPRNTDSPVAVNATMDFAILKELLTNLVEGSKITGLYSDKVELWIEMKNKIPPYMVNEDGALCEWMDPFFEDNYEHRHHSHLYPVFPGTEINSSNNPELFTACITALGKRLEYGLKDQTGWSLAYMANIFARMNRGDDALECLDILTRTNVMNNMMTVHNDWRRMGTAMCNDMRRTPLQVDANMGFTAAVQEMLIFSSEDTIYVFPALPDRWEKGTAGPFLVKGNVEITLFWNKAKESGRISLKSKGDEKTVDLTLPKNMIFNDGCRTKEVKVNNEKFDIEFRFE